MSFGFALAFPYIGGTIAWTPAQITTALWLDANDSSTITLNGSTVSQWNDKSGNGRNATQATAANQPTYFFYQNLLTNSEDFTTAWTLQTGVTALANQVTAPNGTLTGNKVTWTTAPTGTGFYQLYASTGYYTNRTNTKSVWIRADVAGGTVTLEDAGLSGATTTVTLTTDWQRVSHSTLGQTNAAGPWIKKTASSPNDIYVWGAQLNIGELGPYQRTGALRAAAETTGGKPTLAFDGSNDSMVLPAILSGSSAGTVVFVSFNNADPNVAGSAGAPLGDFGADAAADHWPWTDGNIYTDFGSTIRKSYNPTPSLVAWHISSITSDTNLWTAWLDGNQQLTTGTNTVGWGSNPFLGFSTSLYWPGSLAEIVIIPSASTTDRQLTEGYLAWKWGLQANLPVSHPYYNLPPTV